MGINWNGAVQGLAQGISDTAGLMLSAEVQKQRDERMAAYQAKSQQTTFAQQEKMQGQQLQAQGIMTEQKIAAEQQAATLQREQALMDSETEFQRGQKDIKLRAQLDPRAAKTEVNVDTKGEGEFAKTMGKNDADWYEKTRAGAITANETEGLLKALTDIGEVSNTGKTQETLAKIGQYFGTDAGASMQSYNAAVKPLVLASAEKLSGVISDRDMAVLEQAAPNFGNDPRANRVIIGILQRGAKAQKDLYAEMNAHRKEFGNLSDYTPTVTVYEATPTKEESIGIADNPGSVLGGFEQWDANN